MSFGGSGTSYLMTDAVLYAANHGVVMVASSGNDGITQPMYPAYSRRHRRQRHNL